MTKIAAKCLVGELNRALCEVQLCSSWSMVIFLTPHFLHHSSSIRKQNKTFSWTLTWFCHSSVDDYQWFFFLPHNVVITVLGSLCQKECVRVALGWEDFRAHITWIPSCQSRLTIKMFTRQQWHERKWIRIIVGVKSFIYIFKCEGKSNWTVGCWCPKMSSKIRFIHVKCSLM